ncbi:hypothetical protein EJ063_08220 [Vibrio aquaticus]|uniref:Uncharacterized protein n=1 Tax=Vibrio aquaticus TaxID=2496559 RepID=A0A3S0P7I2_9VIBR|nr:hypothetical protein EJ063_08220 [Vibrio aquaticus]
MGLSKKHSTKYKMLLAEPFGQRLWILSAALSAYQVGRLHFKASALHKKPTNCCKNHLERSTDPINKQLV